MKLEPEGSYTAWHKPSQEIIFGISSGTTTLSLKDIPVYAKEIKAHIYLSCGTNYNYRQVSWYFSTLYDAAKVKCSIYNQNAHTFTNQIITLMLDERRLIDVNRDNAYPDSCVFSFEIILYR